MATDDELRVIEAAAFRYARKRGATPDVADTYASTIVEVMVYAIEGTLDIQEGRK